MKVNIKDISPVWAVGLILTFVCMALFVSSSAFVQAISHYGYDALIRRFCSKPKSASVAIVDLDDGSLVRYGQWPWPRYRVARLTELIFEAGAKVVAFDIVFAEPDRTSPVMLEKDISSHFNLPVKIEGIPEELTDFDVIFAEALRKGNAVLGCGMVVSDEVYTGELAEDPGYAGQVVPVCKGFSGDISEHLFQSRDIRLALPLIAGAGRTAFVNANPDWDNVIRSSPLVWQYGSRIYPSLSLQAVLTFLGFPKCRVRFVRQGVEGIELKDRFIPTDRRSCVVINYRKPEEKAAGYRGDFYSSFPRYSAADILDGKLPEGSLDGKIVFVGSSAVGLKDIKATPVSQFLSGVEVHATIVDNILASDLLLLPDYIDGVHCLAILPVGVCLVAVIARSRSWVSFIFALVVVALLVKTSTALIDRWHVVFVPTWEIITVGILYPTLTTIKFWQEEQQKKRVRDMFGTMVSRTVLQYLESHPESFSLSGRRVDATIFFSDVAGFTTISEKLEPERLSDLLNSYLSPMTHIIMERGGYVDKYEGDAIMAEWGVPFSVADHAVQACLAAIEQQEKLEEIRPALLAKFGYRIDVRMGLNSGPVTAGNMGSDRRFQYTVMGDAVNFAARLEPANKDYGTRILIGEATFLAAKGAIEARLLDKIVVQGKSVPVAIYELVGRKGQVSKERLNILRFYEEALRLHWDRRWEDALHVLDEALKLDPSDRPCRMLYDRIRWYQENPPPSDWAGEYVRGRKD